MPKPDTRALEAVPRSRAEVDVSGAPGLAGGLLVLQHLGSRRAPDVVGGDGHGVKFPHKTCYLMVTERHASGYGRATRGCVGVGRAGLWRLVVFRRRRLRLWGGMVLVAACALAGCSSSGGKPGGTVPPLKTAGTDASATASASGSDAPVTKNSLSDPKTSYTVLSIPDDLDTEQSQVVKAYVDYGRATWEAYRDMKGTTKVESVTAGDQYQAFKKVYDERAAAGQHVEGEVSTTITSAQVNPDRFSSTVAVCTDETKVRLVSQDGAQVPSDDLGHKISLLVGLIRNEKGWVVNYSSVESKDQC